MYQLTLTLHSVKHTWQYDVIRSFGLTTASFSFFLSLDSDMFHLDWSIFNVAILVLVRSIMIAQMKYLHVLYRAVSLTLSKWIPHLFTGSPSTSSNVQQKSVWNSFHRWITSSTHSKQKAIQYFTRNVFPGIAKFSYEEIQISLTIWSTIVEIQVHIKRASGLQSVKLRKDTRDKIRLLKIDVRIPVL
jgi:hypothetical protein